MSTFTTFGDWLFEPLTPPRSALRVIVWWEKRRIPYNLIVGLVGSISLFLVYFFASRTHQPPEGEDLIEPIALIFAPFFINFCYTAGWVVELLVLPSKPRRPVGPRLLRLGLIVSVSIVALPGILWSLTWLVYALRNGGGVQQPPSNTRLERPSALGVSTILAHRSRARRSSAGR